MHKNLSTLSTDSLLINVNKQKKQAISLLLLFINTNFFMGEKCVEYKCIIYISKNNGNKQRNKFISNC